jgi:hypothetical protein
MVQARWHCNELIDWYIHAATHKDDMLPSATMLSDCIFEAHQKFLLHQQLRALTAMLATGGTAKSVEQLVNFVQ